MGWKALKEHYDIGHIVQVDGDRILIGSGYVPEIIAIEKDLTISRKDYIGRGEPFDGYVSAMEQDKSTLRRLTAILVVLLVIVWGALRLSHKGQESKPDGDEVPF